MHQDQGNHVRAFSTVPGVYHQKRKEGPPTSYGLVSVYIRKFVPAGPRFRTLNSQERRSRSVFWRLSTSTYRSGVTEAT